ncbi:MAG: DUF1311 domain-containing protein [Xanthomonadaceae bacterium]|nr:DUF1311 domain-containing protein [Xanthomonadaceae bacterium]
MAIPGFTLDIRAMFLIASCVGFAGCASTQSTQSARAAKADFTGGWSVKWCHRTNPALECGGFNVTLAQDGDRICGRFGGALVNLRQIDDGSIVGTVVGNTAVLSVESFRNGSIALVRATRKGGELHWRQVDEILPGETDIAIIAMDDVLVKSHGASAQVDKHEGTRETCSAVPILASVPSSEDSAVQGTLASLVAAPDQSAVMEELSARSRIPLSELQSLLGDCSRTQLSMNMCAFRTYVAADLELDAVLTAKRESALPQCRAEMDRIHLVWEADRDRSCNEATEAEEGGSVRPMLISACKTEATRARIAFVKELDLCPQGETPLQD